MPIQVGQTAKNPETGQRIIFDGKTWKPVGATGVMSDTKPDQEAVVKIRDAAKQAEWVASQAGEFGKLNEQTGTGPLNNIGIPLIAPNLGANVAKLFSSNTAAMQAITKRVAPQVRPAGSGSTSNWEGGNYEIAIPNVGNYGGANAKIIGQLKADAQDKRAYADFADQWYAKNGTLLGADKAWAAAKAPPRSSAPPRPVTAAPKAASGWSLERVEKGG